MTHSSTHYKHRSTAVLKMGRNSTSLAVAALLVPSGLAFSLAGNRIGETQQVTRRPGQPHPLRRSDILLPARIRTAPSLAAVLKTCDSWCAFLLAL